jgi:hypothetical protein
MVAGPRFEPTASRHHLGPIGPNCPVWRFLGDVKMPPCLGLCEPVARGRGTDAFARLSDPLPDYGISTGRQQSNSML